MKELTDYKTDDIECGILEINVHKRKWILFGIYRPPSQEVNYFFDEMGKAIDHYSNCYKNFVTKGDFDIEEKQAEIKNIYGNLSTKKSH